MFVIKVTAKQIVLLGTFKDMSCYIVETLENLYIKSCAAY